MIATRTAPYVFDENRRPAIVIKDSEEHSAVTFALQERIRTAQHFAENRRFSEECRAGYAREAEILQRMLSEL